MKPLATMRGRVALVVIAIAIAIALFLLLSLVSTSLTSASRRRSPLGPPRGRHEDVSRLEESGESGGGTPAARGSMGIPDVPSYPTAAFCPQVATPFPPSTPMTFARHMPLAMNEYTFPHHPAYSLYGVAGADKGNDARGECPGTNDMADLGLPSSLSYDWWWGDHLDTNSI